MTRREFDALTKVNAGRGWASDERWQYRSSRLRAHHGCGAYGPNGPAMQKPDQLAERARWRRKNPGEPIFSMGSVWRGRVTWRLLGRFPSLPLTPQERAAREGRKYDEFRGI
jgi:hypothetical protein